MTEIKLPYKIGDTLWITTGFSYSREVSCLKCVDGKVILQDGSSMPCGICGGNKSLMMHKPYRILPKKVTITGFDIHNKKGEMEVWWFTKEGNNFNYTKDFMLTFLEARQKARYQNKKYNWPKENFERDPYDHPHKVYWGYRIRK